METLTALEQAGLESAGAGRNIEEAERPALLEVPGDGRVLVFSLGSPTSGIPPAWAAMPDRAGVDLLPDLSERTVRRIATRVEAARRPGDIVVASVHWGGNWGYAIPRAQRSFAHGLIDRAGVDVVHGHSSHHPKGIEVYAGKPILYGCGDFLNDYEGIRGYREFRSELGLMYFVVMEPSTGKLEELQLSPTRVERFRVHRASEEESLWLHEMLTREGEPFGTRAEQRGDGTLRIRWS
jgi:poly-gamma-glutamate synthesis protein (capsule biosynthesis protein)